MDTFSLEDQDGIELFLTQQGRNNCAEMESNDGESDSSFLGLDADDFCSPCVSLVPNAEGTQHYSDISDEEAVFQETNKR